MLLRVRDLEIGWAKAQELRDAIRALRDAGRRASPISRSKASARTVEYYVASAADEALRGARRRGAPLIGLAAEYVFLGGLWDKLGVDVQVAQAGEYKGAAESIAGHAMTESYREMANSLLDSIDGAVRRAASPRRAACRSRPCAR